MTVWQQRVFCFTVIPMSSRVLIVDDSAHIRRLIRTTVEGLGLDVCGEAEDGFAGVQRAQELRPDVVLLDLSMPVMNGAEAASVLKTKLPSTQIVLFTMFDFGEALAAAVGIDVVLCKSEGVSKLSSYLRAQVDKQKTSSIRENNFSTLVSTSISPQSAGIEQFDIFRVLEDGEFAWLEPSPTIDDAKAKILALGQTQPGTYIIFCQKSGAKITVAVPATQA
jgi:DNA-binding NarL/FixJ family response regulator